MHGSGGDWSTLRRSSKSKKHSWTAVPPVDVETVSLIVAFGGERPSPAAQPLLVCQHWRVSLMVQTERPRSRREMPAVHPDAAAIDVGATMHVVAVPPDRDPEPVRTFGTFTADLHRLADWLRACRIKTVVMESTGVYWIPIFEILEHCCPAINRIKSI